MTSVCGTVVSRAPRLGSREHALGREQSATALRIAGVFRASRPVCRRKGLVVSAARDARDEEEHHATDVPPQGKAEDGEDNTKLVIESAQKLSKALVAPLRLGKKSREAVDSVWSRVTQLGQVFGSPSIENDMYFDEKYMVPMKSDRQFFSPQAPYTTVLVVGATGRVGRVLIRKLILRGYTVKALVRPGSSVEGLPRTVEVIEGDVKDLAKVHGAIRGCNKVIWCVRSLSTIKAELMATERDGVGNVARAFLDQENAKAARRAGRSPKVKLTVAKFNKEEKLKDWEASVEEEERVDKSLLGKYADLMEEGTASFELSEQFKAGKFHGSLSSGNGGVAWLEKYIDHDLSRYEGMVLNVRGDGKKYRLALSGDNYTYGANFYTIANTWFTVRIPFNQLRSDDPDAPPLFEEKIYSVAVGFEAVEVSPNAKKNSSDARAWQDDASKNDFNLEISYIKAQPSGEEPDFIMVSCAGSATELETEEERQKVIAAKQSGEALLRNSGLGYTIVRPGPLLDVPGGAKALCFDQGDRITQPIACADVAEVCLKAMHEPAARNLSFEVCYEREASDDGLYELVAQLPEKSGSNYLEPALQGLEKNT